MESSDSTVIQLNFKINLVYRRTFGTIVRRFAFCEIVALQQRTFRHEKSKIFRATFLRRKAWTNSNAFVLLSVIGLVYRC